MKDAVSGHTQDIVKLLTEIVAIENAIFRIIISPAAVSKLKVLNEVGLTSVKAINLKGVSISPREFLERYFCYLPRLEIKRAMMFIW